MLDHLRQFEVSDPFTRTWKVEFRWHQNAISIRHCDSVDCKYYISHDNEKRELVVALMHVDLLAVAAARGRELTDPWCMDLAGRHVQHMISTWEDMEKTISTPSRVDLERYSLQIEGAARSKREQTLLAH